MQHNQIVELTKSNKTIYDQINTNLELISNTLTLEYQKLNELSNDLPPELDKEAIESLKIFLNRFDSSLKDERLHIEKIDMQIRQIEKDTMEFISRLGPSLKGTVLNAKNVLESETISEINAIKERLDTVREMSSNLIGMSEEFKKISGLDETELKRIEQVVHRVLTGKLSEFKDELNNELPSLSNLNTNLNLKYNELDGKCSKIHNKLNGLCDNFEYLNRDMNDHVINQNKLLSNLQTDSYSRKSEIENLYSKLTDSIDQVRYELNSRIRRIEDLLFNNNIKKY